MDSNADPGSDLHDSRVRANPSPPVRLGPTATAVWRLCLPQAESRCPAARPRHPQPPEGSGRQSDQLGALMSTACRPVPPFTFRQWGVVEGYESPPDPSPLQNPRALAASAAWPPPPPRRPPRVPPWVPGKQQQQQQRPFRHRAGGLATLGKAGGLRERGRRVSEMAREASALY